MFGRLFVEVKHLARSIGLLSTRDEWRFQRGANDARLKILCNRCTGFTPAFCGTDSQPDKVSSRKTPQRVLRGWGSTRQEMKPERRSA